MKKQTLLALSFLMSLASAQQNGLCVPPPPHLQDQPLHLRP